MITWYSHTAERQWHDGGFKVELWAWNQPRPIGYCDGSEADEAELRGIAEEEGLEELRIERRYLKLGRERWTLTGAVEEEPED